MDRQQAILRCTFIGEIGEATAIDNCDVDIEITNNAPLTFSLGETIVTWTAIDDYGNQSTCTQVVEVTNTEPTISSLSTFDISNSNQYWSHTLYRNHGY